MQNITYTIIRSKKRRTVSVVVRPDGTVRLMVPVFLPERRIEEIIQEKKQWIQSKLDYFKNTDFPHVTHRSYTDGELFPYLGRHYPLRIAPSQDACKGQVKLKGGRLNLYLAIGSTELSQKKELVEGWYKDRAADYLQRKTIEIGRELGMVPTQVIVKGYKSRWGACDSKGRIFLNWKIILAPPEVIRYVIIHELCHLLQPDHSSRYWRLVGNVMPDYGLHREWLRRHNVELDLCSE